MSDFDTSDEEELFDEQDSDNDEYYDMERELREE